jgi:hypothetical protein
MASWLRDAFASAPITRTPTLELPGAPEAGGPAPEYFVGLDLGQVNDSTAIAVVERRTRDGERPTYGIRHLQSWLGEPYPSLVGHVVGIMGRPPLDGARALVVDRTGVGRPVFDLFRMAGLTCSVIGVTITAGDLAHSDDAGGWFCPKRDLIGAAQVLLQGRRLEIAKRLPLAETLAGELRDFRVSISPAGHDSYNAREGKHDDLLLAMSMAIWAAERGVLRRAGAF